ncbi:MAG: endolytic transglycosylase MltG [Bacteroidales bacterium]|nr:endolytic transglycosylase MltG [Bacteroidales bacterium]
MKKKIILIIFLLIFFVGAAFAAYFYKMFFTNNIALEAGKSQLIFLPTGGNINNLYDSLEKYEVLENMSSFKMLSNYKNLEKRYKSGCYKIEGKMSNNALVNMFASGRQQPIKIVFNNIKTKEDLAKRVGTKLECGEKALLDVLKNDSIIQEYGFTKDNFMSVFIPNTYEVYWNMPAEQFVEKMFNEWKSFWTVKRLQKAKDIGLSPIEITILSSIVFAETKKADEMSTVAGVYINRLKKGWKLQADPTVIYGIGDFSITRVRKKHLEFDSPYNTYIYEGLPPGPINLPEPYVIDHVLNYKKHNYMFFCAKEDFSGYHNFAETGAQHSANAAKYQKALSAWERKKRLEKQK